eukprot:2676224-Alexandrium_andersonii.AAC.1
MFPDGEAPELQPIAAARQFWHRHRQLVSDGALRCPMQHTAQLLILEARGEACRTRVLSPGDQFRLLLRPAQDCSDVGKTAEQEGPGSMLPGAGIGPHA